MLLLAALLLAIGGAMHASAFGQAVSAVDGSNLPAFFGASLKMLWVGDSAMMFVLAIICIAIAAWPTTASKPILLLLALFPASTAILLYVFLGKFFAGHLLLGVAIVIFAAGLLSSSNPQIEGEPS